MRTYHPYIRDCIEPRLRVVLPYRWPELAGSPAPRPREPDAGQITARVRSGAKSGFDSIFILAALGSSGYPRNLFL